MTDTTTPAVGAAEAVDHYLAMWSTPHADRRRELCELAFTPDAVFCDPIAEAVGHRAIDELVAGIQEQFPGSIYVLDSAIDAHHDRIRYRWEMRDADGNATLEGHDVAVVAPDGRLARVDGFFGPLTDGAEA